jgi:hypothetical protein
LFFLYQNDILAHPFFESLHDPMEEPTIERMVDEHQDANHNIEMWKRELFSMKAFASL